MAFAAVTVVGFTVTLLTSASFPLYFEPKIPDWIHNQKKRREARRQRLAGPVVNIGRSWSQNPLIRSLSRKTDLPNMKYLKVPNEDIHFNYILMKD